MHWRVLRFIGRTARNVFEKKMDVKGLAEDTLVDLQHETTLDVSMAIKREKLRSLRLANEKLEGVSWRHGVTVLRDLVVIVAVAVVGLVFYACSPFVLYVLLQTLDNMLSTLAKNPALVISNYTRFFNETAVVNPFRLMYDLIGCSYIQVIYKSTGGSTIGNAWFYLFNHTINKSQCF
jgi:hypothetical protein